MHEIVAKICNWGGHCAQLGTFNLRFAYPLPPTCLDTSVFFSISNRIRSQLVWIFWNKDVVSRVKFKIEKLRREKSLWILDFIVISSESNDDCFARLRVSVGNVSAIQHSQTMRSIRACTASFAKQHLVREQKTSRRRREEKNIR